MDLFDSFVGSQCSDTSVLATRGRSRKFSLNYRFLYIGYGQSTKVNLRIYRYILALAATGRRKFEISYKIIELFELRSRLG